MLPEISRPCRQSHSSAGGVVFTAITRLEVLPLTRLCVECVREVGGEFDLVVVPENLAKAGSSKKNYGSFELLRVRKR